VVYFINKIAINSLFWLFTIVFIATVVYSTVASCTSLE
jgi:hypothetical protein